MKTHNERRVSPTLRIKPESHKTTQIEEEDILGVHYTIETTLRGDLNPEIRKTLRKIFYAIILVFVMKKRDQKNGTTHEKKMILQQPHVMVILSLFVMMLVSI